MVCTIHHNGENGENGQNSVITWPSCERPFLEKSLFFRDTKHNQEHDTKTICRYLFQTSGRNFSVGKLTLCYPKLCYPSCYQSTITYVCIQSNYCRLVFIIFRYVAYISLFPNLSHVSNLILLFQIRSKFLIIFFSPFWTIFVVRKCWVNIQTPFIYEKKSILWILGISTFIRNRHIVRKDSIILTFHVPPFYGAWTMIVWISDIDSL